MQTDAEPTEVVLIKNTGRFMLLAAAALSAYAPGVDCQQVAKLDPVVVVANPEADRMQQKAEALYGERNKMGRAAALRPIYSRFRRCWGLPKKSRS